MPEENTPGTADAAIRALVDQYRQSIDAADTILAAQLWATTDDVSFIHPRGHEHGWEEVRTHFYEQTMGERFSDRTLTIHRLAVHVCGDAAWAEFYWTFVVTCRSDGSQIRTQGRESQVFARRGTAWTLVHVHYASLPVTGEREGF
jgi:ketosteroid isomerase-like protein